MRYLPSGFIAAGILAVSVFGEALATPAAATWPRESEARYQEGLNLERRGDLRAAVDAYREAADSGHGMAQRKLGDIYGTGKDGVERDYENSLRWYTRTRDQGIDVPNKPFVYPGVRR